MEEKKPEPKKVEDKKPEPKKVEPKKEEKVKENQKEQNIIENANYLCEIMNLNFTNAYKFSKEYAELTKEELLNIYLSRM